MATITDLSELIINYLTQDQYDAALQAGTIDENQLYLISGDSIATSIITQSAQPTKQSSGDYWYHITGIANI